MKVFLGLAITLCLLYTASAEGCASDQYNSTSTGLCTCNTTLYNSSVRAAPPALQCLPGQIKLTLSRCQLEVAKYNPDNVHLLDPSCVGLREVNGIAETVLTTNATRGTCGNILWVNGSHAIYSNNLTIPAKVYASGITAKQNISFNFSCSYPLNMSVVLVSAIKPVIGSTDITLPGGIGSVTVTMAVYTTPDFTNPYTESTLPLNVEDSLYVSVQIPALEATLFSVRVMRLYAKGTNQSTDAVTYDLISAGCPSGDLGSLVTVEKNGDTIEARFVVSVFKITNSDSVYLFADVEICEGRCIPACGGGRASDRAITGEPAKLSGGPYIAMEFGLGSGASDRFSWTWTVNSILLSLLGLRLL